MFLKDPADATLLLHAHSFDFLAPYRSDMAMLCLREVYDPKGLLSARISLLGVARDDADCRGPQEEALLDERRATSHEDTSDEAAVHALAGPERMAPDATVE